VENLLKKTDKKCENGEEMRGLCEEKKGRGKEKNRRGTPPGEKKNPGGRKKEMMLPLGRTRDRLKTGNSRSQGREGWDTVEKRGTRSRGKKETQEKTVFREENKPNFVNAIHKSDKRCRQTCKGVKPKSEGIFGGQGANCYYGKSQSRYRGWG